MNDDTNYIPEELYLDSHSDEEVIMHLFFPKFFIFIPSENTGERCWILNDKETPELRFLNSQDLP